MKATKKIVGATCALVAAVALSAGSTFAWFSANTSVNATGMNVTAKSNATYLLIGNTAECASVKTSLTNTVAATYATTGNDTKTCYPVSYCSVNDTLGTFTATGAVAGKWYTANSDNSGSAGGSGTLLNLSEVTLGDKDYMLTYNVWLTLSADSENTTNKVKVTFSKGASDDAALSVAVKVDSQDPLLLNSTTTNLTTASSITLTKDTAIPVVVYVYIDGNSTNVNSDYINGHTIAGTAKIDFDLVSAT